MDIEIEVMLIKRFVQTVTLSLKVFENGIATSLSIACLFCLLGECQILY